MFIFPCFLSNQLQKSNTSSLKSYDKKLRTYRLALAATGEYSQYHIEAVNAQDKSRQEQIEIVMASMEIAVGRINYLLENDLAIKLELVEFNNDLAFSSLNCRSQISPCFAR